LLGFENGGVLTRLGLRRLLRLLPRPLRAKRRVVNLETVGRDEWPLTSEQRCNNCNDLYSLRDIFQTPRKSCRPFFGGSTRARWS
jgi:hypothetical protein